MNQPTPSFNAAVYPLGKPLVALLALAASLVLGGCLQTSSVGQVVKAAGYTMGKQELSTTFGIAQQDQDQLSSGNFFAVIDRYQQQQDQGERLTFQQHRLLCDLYVTVNNLHRAHNCLESLHSRVEGGETTQGQELEAILGRMALLYMKLGWNDKASALTVDLETDGGRYIHALAMVRNGELDEPRRIADQFALGYFYPRKVYFAANIYLALGDYARARDLALSPRTRLARDYGLKPGQDIFGNEIQNAEFRIDLFEEFKFGFFDAFSYAPPANPYVEFVTAKSLLETGDRQAARERFAVIVASGKAAPFRDILWMSLVELARITRDEGHTDEAIDYYQRALELIETIRSTIATEAGRIGYLADKFDVYAELAALQKNAGRLSEALETAERAKSRALVDLLSNRDDFQPSFGDAQNARALYQEVQSAESGLALRGNLGKETMVTRLRNVSEARQNLIKRAPHLASLVSVPPIDYSQLVEGLQAEEAGILYHRFGDLLYIFAFDHQGVEVHTTDANQVNALITQLRNTIPNYRSRGYRRYAQMLYDLLIRPISPAYLRQRLVIAPADTLFYLPFPALHDGQQFLLDQHIIRIVPSFHALSVIPREPAPNQRLLVLGNPDRKDPELDLPGAEREAKQLSAGLRDVTLLLNADASEGNFYRLAPEYGYIHIAGHGQFLPHSPLHSRLLLAPDDNNDGDVTVNDLYSLRLHADLVVLSACETALSLVSKGDELIGLMRGFFYAGGKGVVGSLWKVEDDSTALMMERLYHHIEAGDTPEQALTKAQQQVAERYPHPFFWAAFQYTGGGTGS